MNKPLPVSSSDGIIGGHNTLNYERGIRRGELDYGDQFQPPVDAADRARWPEPFRAGWTLGRAFAKAKAMAKATN